MLQLETSYDDPSIGERLENMPVAMIQEVVLNFTWPKISISHETICNLAEHIFMLIKRFERLPASQNKLVIFRCMIPPSPVANSMILKVLGEFPRPLTVYWQYMQDFQYFCTFHAGNIREFYAVVINEFRYASGGYIGIRPQTLRETNLVDFGVFEFGYMGKIRRPRDRIDVARDVVKFHKSGRLKFVDDLVSEKPDLAYALRCNRDILNRYYDVCTLMMLARQAEPKKRFFLPMLTKDCMRLILSHLRQKDWDFSDQKRRNITQRTSKAANELIRLEGERRKIGADTRNSKRMLDDLEEERRTYEERRAKALKTHKENRKKKKVAQSKVDEVIGKIKI